VARAHGLRALVRGNMCRPGAAPLVAQKNWTASPFLFLPLRPCLFGIEKGKGERISAIIPPRTGTRRSYCGRLVRTRYGSTRARPADYSSTNRREAFAACHSAARPGPASRTPGSISPQTNPRSTATRSPACRPARMRSPAFGLPRVICLRCYSNTTQYRPGCHTVRPWSQPAPRIPIPPLPVAARQSPGRSFELRPN